MIQYESGFDPSQTYTESFTDRSGNRVVSTGLLQLSQESARGYGHSVTTQDLMDPYVNLQVGVDILEHWVSRDGVIAGDGNTGGGRYWSVLRPTGKRQNIINSINQ
jgi:soluble lytic murein transglycosylase-like protein